MRSSVVMPRVAPCDSCGCSYSPSVDAQISYIPQHTPAPFTSTLHCAVHSVHPPSPPSFLHPPSHSPYITPQASPFIYPPHPTCAHPPHSRRAGCGDKYREIVAREGAGRTCRASPSYPTTATGLGPQGAGLQDLPQGPAGMSEARGDHLVMVRGTGRCFHMPRVK